MTLNPSLEQSGTKIISVLSSKYANTEIFFNLSFKFLNAIPCVLLQLG